ncbi:hypothetical protein [Spirillospora albida]|uniref:hypothetical protein n=1 Tax=Spirillospora albida TaxID=58123 RepID=UPI0004C21292|nr:hypothetical protein [Spirillospora albida]
MRSRILFVAVWLATTAAGIAISWAGVGDALRGTVLPTRDLAADVPVREGRPPTATPVPERTPERTPATARETRRPSPSASPGGGGTAKPPAPSGKVRAYTVKSGRVVLSIGTDSARLVSAMPNSGFQVKTWRNTAWLRVDLTDGTHGSAVFVTWNGHPPLVEVYEY